MGLCQKKSLIKKVLRHVTTLILRFRIYRYVIIVLGCGSRRSATSRSRRPQTRGVDCRQKPELTLRTTHFTGRNFEGKKKKNWSLSLRCFGGGERRISAAVRKISIPHSLPLESKLFCGSYPLKVTLL